MPPDTRFIMPALVLGTEDEGSAELLGLAEADVEAGVEGTADELSVLVDVDSEVLEELVLVVVVMVVGVSLELLEVLVDSSVEDECEAVLDGVGSVGSPVAPATVKRGR